MTVPASASGSGAAGPQPGPTIGTAALPVWRRRDYAFPFRVDPSSHQAMVAAYERHVDQLVRQLLLTSPGERVNLPEFGCGLRELVFAPASEPLVAALRLRVHAALTRWLGDQIQLHDVTVVTDRPGEPGTVEVTVTYTLLETRAPRALTVTVV
jgi:phage baseplate assembly protein W